MPDKMVAIDGWMILAGDGMERLESLGFKPGEDGEIITSGESGTGLFYRPEENLVSGTPADGPALGEPILVPALSSMMWKGESVGAFLSGLLVTYITEAEFQLEAWHKRDKEPMTRHQSIRVAM